MVSTKVVMRLQIFSLCGAVGRGGRGTPEGRGRIPIVAGRGAHQHVGRQRPRSPQGGGAGPREGGSFARERSAEKELNIYRMINLKSELK